jgi:hypothetical protein
MFLLKPATDHLLQQRPLRLLNTGDSHPLSKDSFAKRSGQVAHELRGARLIRNLLSCNARAGAIRAAAVPECHDVADYREPRAS